MKIKENTVKNNREFRHKYYVFKYSKTNDISGA